MLATHRAALADYLAAAARVREDAWRVAPAHGKWSPAQVTAHVVLMYEAWLAELEGGAGLALRLPAWRRLLVRATHWRGLVRGRFPAGAPSPPELRPRDWPLSRDETLARLEDVATRLERGIARAAEVGARRRLTHPYFGGVRLGDALPFCAAHTRHHAAQLAWAGPLGSSGIDGWLPRWHVRERHARRIRARIEDVHRATMRVDLAGARTVRALFRLRGMPRGSLSLDGMRRLGFVLLEEAPGRGVVLGVVGAFWRPGARPRVVTPAQFRAFAEPGHALAAWSFAWREAEPGVVVLETETRVWCTDARARRRFRVYWLAIRPFSGWIRRVALRVIATDAETRAAS